MVDPSDANLPPADTAAPSVTVHDVAREAGVSQSAVSRAFTPGSSLAADKRERIIAAAARLGYRPNPLARSLIRGRSGIVGVGVGNLANPFFVETLQLLSDCLDRTGLRLMLFPAQGEPSIQDVLHYRIDALVLLSVSLSSMLATECRRAGVPIILYNRTTDQRETSCVVGDNAIGARSVAAHLLAGGHQRLAFMAGSPDASTNIEREAGFTAYLAEQGHPAPLRECGHFAFDAAMAATRRLLLRPDRPDALFCANDTMALAAVTVARHEFGLDVGREISIVGYDDVPMAAWPGFALTSYSQPASLMVDETVRLIHALRQSPKSHEAVVCPGTLVIRGSSRPVRVEQFTR
ncbi:MULTISPECIES: LacI family DNA-binding transcriptional regulator [unclassified Novosphingobium]|uniref:LacI family DNA-binding transcriptional regulator n=1 Tax=Novosphingobium TaxID=165696 RepID=UPI00146EA3A8|nr:MULTISPECIES: LacI family DNA-binding transcriptional regulator [unclassified Novosphingobium]NMN04632.1 DNA-binding LacI/PurR family transcriptional regulator [Novosphingobium sp. SG919]NMN85375.1 DNA-binding LacI/PurR family transcriptional regulator [Novosphingobium sp. SG916]